MKKVILFFSIMMISEIIYSQTDSLSKNLQPATLTVPKYLPDHMIFTQRWAWGEHGFLRGKKPITPEVRYHEMKIRKNMFVAHQILACATFAGFIGQAIVGPKLYADPFNTSLEKTHSTIAAFTNLSYLGAASMALFAPPRPLGLLDKGRPALRWHRGLAIVHFTGWLTTNILGSLMQGGANPQLRPYHRAAAFTTFIAYTAAMLVIEIK